MELRRFAKGFTWGLVATGVMTVLMIGARVTGISPMPKPVPMAVLAAWDVFLPAWLALVGGFAVHFVYGGFWAGYLTLLSKRVTIWQGLALGVVLWVVMGWIFLPFVGWGAFGRAAGPDILWAMLILHLVYGLTYGALMDRGVASGTETGAAAEAARSTS